MERKKVLQEAEKVVNVRTRRGGEGQIDEERDSKTRG